MENLIWTTKRNTTLLCQQNNRGKSWHLCRFRHAVSGSIGSLLSMFFNHDYIQNNTSQEGQGMKARWEKGGFNRRDTKKL